MDIKEKNPPPTTRPKRFLDNFLTCRRVLNIMVFLGFMVNYMLRVNLNFAIVDMIYRAGDSNQTFLSTPINLSTTYDGSNLTRVTRSALNAEEEDEEDEEDNRKFRKNNFVGTNAGPPKPSNNNPPGAFQSSGSNASGSNQANGFQTFGSDSAGNQPPGGSVSAGNQPSGFQSPSGDSGGNQPGGFQSVGSSLGGNQSGEFQSSSQLGGKTQPNGSSDFNSSLSTQQSEEPPVQQTKVTGLNSDLQAAPSGGQSNENSSQKVGLASNSLDDSIIGEEVSKDGRILYTKDSEKKPLEVGNAQLDQDSQTSSTPVPTKGSKKKKKTRHQKPNVQRFRWSEAEQGYLIGSFFWGYILTELPGGRLAEIIGARKVFGYATLGASVVTLLTPMFAKIHFIMVLIIRILLGLFLGPTWPSILPLASKWIPMNERGKFLSNMMGSTLGAGFTLPVCGFIIDTFSWEYVFYITGLLGFIWSIMWFLVVFETPADHPRITPEERWYIESNLGLKPSKSSADNYSREEKQVSQGLMLNAGDESCLSDNEQDQKSSDECRNYSTFTRNSNASNGNPDIRGSSKDKKSSTGSISDTNLDTVQKSNTNKNDLKIAAVSSTTNGDLKTSEKQSEKPKAPWFQIITSIPVWAFVLTHGASVFGYNTITNQLPTFMDHILNYEIKENGILSSFPYIGKYIAAVVGGTIADKLLKSSMFTKNFVRKLLTTIGVFLPGCLMLFQIFVGSDKTFSIFVFTAALTANGVVVGGYLGNSLDIAPNFSGTVFGLGNMFSGLSGAVSALLVGYLTDHNQVYGQWQKVFFIVGLTYILGALIFLIFGSTDVQPWNYSSDQKKKNEIDSDVDEETGILESSRRRSSVSSAIKSYTEDEWDTSSFLSGLDSASKLRKKCNRRRIRPETETESVDSSRKKHLRFEQPPQDREVSTLKPLIGDQYRDSDSDYADIEDKTRQRQLEKEDVKLRKSRGEKYNNEDYLLSIKKRASYKEAIENGSHSDYSYDSENKTHSPAMSQHQRKIKNPSDSNESLRTTSRIRKDTRKQNNQFESADESKDEKKTRNRRHKSRKIRDDEEDDDVENNEHENTGDFSTKQKRESYSKKQKSFSKQSTSISNDESDNDADQKTSRKKSKKFQTIDLASSSQLSNVTDKMRSKSAKNKENTLKNDPGPSTSSVRSRSRDQSSDGDDDEDKPQRKFNLPLSSQPMATIKHVANSPL